MGAARKLDEEFLESIEQTSRVVSEIKYDTFQCHFIPPAGPHFGGI